MNVAWPGAISLETKPTGLQPWRIPITERDLFEPALQPIAAEAAGIRLAFLADTREVHLKTEPAPPHDIFPNWSFDLCVDGKFHQRVTHPRTATEFHFTSIPAGKHRIELYLYQHAPVTVRSLEVAGALEPWHDPRPRWIVHGSSITHCGAAAGPSETWPAIVANRFDLNHTNLGYGGQCHLDPMVARMIRDLPADYISLCFGINVCGAASLTERTFRAAVIGFLKTIRDGHPNIPIVLVSPIYHPPREPALAKMRDQIDDAVRCIRDPNLHYVNGLDLFGPAFLHHMPDELHPNAEGYRVLAQRYSEFVMTKFGIASHRASRVE